MFRDVCTTSIKIFNMMKDQEYDELIVIIAALAGTNHLAELWISLQHILCVLTLSKALKVSIHLYPEPLFAKATLWSVHMKSRINLDTYWQVSYIWKLILNLTGRKNVTSIPQSIKKDWAVALEDIFKYSHGTVQFYLGIISTVFSLIWKTTFKI